MIALLLALIVGCQPTPGPSPPEPPPPHVPSCARACARLAELGCKEGKPTPKGATCQEVCEHTEASGYLSLNPGCVERITSCDQVNSCATAR